MLAFLARQRTPFKNRRLRCRQHRVCLAAALFILTFAATPLFAQPTAQDIAVTSYASGIPNPHALCFDSAGTLYTGQTDLASGQGYVYRVNPGVASYRPYGNQEIPDPRALAWDATGDISGTPGSLLVAGSDRLYAILPDESVTSIFTDLGFVSDLTFDRQNRLLIMDELSGVRVTDGAAPVSLFTWPSRLYAIAVTRQGYIYSAIANGDLTVHHSDGTLATASLISGLAEEWELAAGPGGAWGTDVYTVLNNSLVRVAPDGSVVTLRSGFQGCTGLTFGPGDSLYAAAAEEGYIFKITLSSGDCNNNGKPDIQDIGKGTSQDCDDNRVPDECQPDSDGDGTIDACDGCPNDVFKTEPGPCGCGDVEFDADGDGIYDCMDNCPNTPNPFQEDVNNDGIGDACQLPAGLACGAGSCGAGITSMMLFAVLHLMAMQRRRRRRTSSPWP